jgi:integrase
VSIGKHGAPWTPAQARDKALELLAAIKAGNDPLAERDGGRGGTVADVVADWLKRDQAKNRSLREVERIMKREVLPAWGKRPIVEIRKRDIIELIDGIAERAPVMSNRVLAHTKRMLKWAASRDIIESDPAAHVEKVAPESRRDRVLSDDELAALWQAAGDAGFPFGHGVQLLVLTGARREEIFGLSWREVDLEAACIRLPAARAKAKEGRTIPLAPPALDILATAPRIGGGDLAITLNGRNPLGNIHRMKVRLDQSMTAPLGEALNAAPWRLHDIRRTVATGLQRLGVRLEVIEAILGHVSGSRAGIVGLYQRHRFEAEARAALEAWARHVQALAAGRDFSAVVPFARR